MAGIKIGDWARVSAKGYWRIIDVQEIHSIIPFDEVRKTVRARQLCNDRFKIAVKEREFHESLIGAVDAETSSIPENLLHSTPKIEDSFFNHHEEIDHVLNLGFAACAGIEATIDALFSGISSGFMDQDIVAAIRTSDLGDAYNKSLSHKTVRFISRNGKIRDGKLIFERYEISKQRSGRTKSNDLRRIVHDYKNRL